MLKFGKYKGKDIKELLSSENSNYKYIYWCIENIPEFYNLLDKEDKEYYNKYFYPITYLENKYNIQLYKCDLDKLKNILYKEDILKLIISGYEYYDIETIYGWCTGSQNDLTNEVIKNLLIQKLEKVEKMTKQ